MKLARGATKIEKFKQPSAEVCMSNLTLEVPADTWVKATWDEYIQIIQEFNRLPESALMEV
jgi:hypothetical protein